MRNRAGGSRSGAAQGPAPAAGTGDQRRARRTSATAHARQAHGARPMSHRAGAIWASGWDGAEAQRGVAADGEDVAVEVGRWPGVVDGGNLLAVEADRALGDQPPGLTARAGKTGLGQQRYDPDLSVVADRARGDRQLRGGGDVGRAPPGGDTGVERRLGPRRGIVAVVELGDLVREAALDVPRPRTALGGLLKIG